VIDPKESAYLKAKKFQTNLFFSKEKLHQKKTTNWCFE